jgi:hypothetical protein
MNTDVEKTLQLLKLAGAKGVHSSYISKKRRPLSNLHKQHISQSLKKRDMSSWKIGKKRSPESIEKTASKLRGRKRPLFSDEWKQNISLGGKGRTPWNKGKKSTQIPWNKGKKGLQKAWNKGLHIKFNNFLHYWRSNGGTQKGRVNYWAIGDKNVNWKGGITPINEKLRKTFNYKEWRNKVFERDCFCCQECGQRGGYLHAHHIKSWSNYPEFRYQINNGLTLCISCHRKTENYGRFHQSI